jgi:hypothetical protein
MKLYKSYCNEIIRQFGKVPVYLPGEFVQLGDIIFFQHKGLFGPRPIGDFNKRTSLQNLKIGFQANTDPDPQSFKFSSEGSVSMEFTSAGDIQNQAKGQLDISFNKTGATYLVAIDCATSYIDDLLHVEEQLADHIDALDWSSHYIVVGVSVARKSLVMQSNSSSAKLTISGEVKSFDANHAEMPNVSASLAVKAYKDASFLKDWSDNVELFIDLVRYKDMKLMGFNRSVKSFNTELDQTPIYRLENVSPFEGLIEE